MPSEQLSGVALVTGGGRGIGANVARELAACGMRVAVTGRTPSEVESVAAEIGGLALPGDVAQQAEVEGWVAAPRRSSGRSTCSSRTPASREWEDEAWELEPERWWHVLEVNVLGVYLACRAAIPGMLDRGAAGS